MESKTQMKNERTSMVIFTVLNNYSIELVVTKDVVAARKRRDDIYGEDDSENAAAMHSCDGLGAACLIFSEEHRNITIVAHECYHAIRAMMKWAGIYDNEAEAYHMGYLTKQVYDFVRARPKR